MSTDQGDGGTAAMAVTPLSGRCPEVGERAEHACFRWGLAGKLPAGQAPDARRVEHAARSFLAGLPLFINTPAIVGAGTFVFCYHQPPAVLRRLYGGELSWRPVAGRGFAVVAPAVRD